MSAKVIWLSDFPASKTPDLNNIEDIRLTMAYTIQCRQKTSDPWAQKLKTAKLPITLETLLRWQYIFYANTKLDALSYEA